MIMIIRDEERVGKCPYDSSTGQRHLPLGSKMAPIIMALMASQTLAYDAVDGVWTKSSDQPHLIDSRLGTSPH